MKIGYAQTIITPSLSSPVFLAGFGNNRRAQTVHDDLTVRALAVQSGQTTLVLAALDLIGLFAPAVEEVRKKLERSDAFRVLSPHVILAATHTHHGPDTAGLWGRDQKTSGVDQAYLSATLDRIAQTIQTALDDLRACGSMKAAAVRVPGLVKNARDPDLLDEELTLLQFLDPIHRPLVTLANFPCHPEVLWEENVHISADYPAFLRGEVEQRSGAPAIFFAGALGGMMTPDVQDHSFEECAAMGKKLGAQGLQALEAAPAVQPEEIRVERREIKAKLTNLLYKIAFRRKLLPDVRDLQGCVRTEVSLIRIGSTWLAAVPGELLPKLGLQLKEWMRASGAQVTGVIGLANGWLGYILPVEDFRYPLNPFKPGAHYEETNSIGKDITPKVMDALHDLIQARRQ